VSGVRGFGRVGVSSQRRCRADQASAEAFDTFSSRLEIQQGAGRYERQGLLVEENALNEEAECLADAEARERRAARERERRAELDHGFVEQFAKRIRELFRACPPERELQIAEHACRKYSGRIGRSAASRSFDKAAVRLAVAAHIRLFGGHPNRPYVVTSKPAK
jgi:hypothetical protein